MCWYIFYTPRGWAAIYVNNASLNSNIIKASVLPTPSPLTTLSYIYKQETGPMVRFVPFTDNSIPVINKFRDYYKGRIIEDWEVELDLDGFPDFSKKVLRYVYSIPYGTVRSYGDVARAIGKPGASRAIGQVMHLNPIPLIIPCHRVVARNGWGGFSSPGGIEVKKQMLWLEWSHKGRPDTNIPGLT